MDQTLHQLGQLLLASIPTIIVFVLLHYYLKRVLYRPLQQVLSARRERIEGKLQAAQATVALAEQKLSGYEEALRQRRMENYRHIDAQRQAALAAGKDVLGEARQRATATMVAARQRLAAENEQARAELQASVETLSGQILEQVLRSAPVHSVSSPGVGA